MTIEVDCWFVLKEARLEGFVYTRLQIDEPPGRRDGSGALRTGHPPVVDDLILLFDRAQDISGTFRVVSRSWMYSQYGSANWPYHKDQSDVPPGCEVFVVPADGPYVDEVVIPDDDEETQTDDIG